MNDFLIGLIVVFFVLCYTAKKTVNILGVSGVKNIYDVLAGKKK